MLANPFPTENSRTLLKKSIEYAVHYGRGSKRPKRIKEELSNKRNNSQRNEPSWLKARAWQYLSPPQMIGVNIPRK